MKHRIGILFSALSLGVLAAQPAITLKVEPERRVFPAGAGTEAILRIAIDVPETPRKEPQKTRVDLAIALDCSSSMNSQRKIENAREAAQKALDLLGEEDTFSLVTYDSSARVVIPVTRVSASAREEIRQAINAIRTRGTTALFAGVSLSAAELRKAGDVPGRVRRLILLSDGQANVGPSSPSELGRLGAALVKERISVSTVGVGDNYNEDLMTALAQNSDGNFYFVEKSSELSLILEKELGSALSVAAQGVKVKIICPPGVKPRGILGHESKIDAQTIEIDFNQLYSGHRKVLFLQLDLPAQPDGSTLPLAEVRVEYQTNDAKPAPVLLEKAGVTFSRDEKVLESGLNPSVYGETLLIKNRTLREEALREADSGNREKAKAMLDKSQKEVADFARKSNSPALEAAAETMNKENVRFQAAPSGSSDYSSIRKEIKGRNYQEINKQQYRQ